MRKKIISICIFCMCLFLNACGAPGVQIDEMREITDINGDVVSVPKEINRIICRSGNGTSFLVAMGYGDKLVGTADYVVTNPWVDRFYDGVSKLPTFKWSPSSEEIYKVGADLVMLADPEVAADLRKDGITAICYKQYNGDEIVSSAKLMGELFGEEAKQYADEWIAYYEEIQEYLDTKLASVSEEDKPTVYYIYGQSNKGLGRTAGGGSIIEYVIEEAGGKFATPDLPNDGPKITEEEAIVRNPDVIFISGIYGAGYKEELKTSPIWSGVNAVQEERIYQIPMDFISWDYYGVEFPLYLLWTSKQLYPDLIDKDMFTEAKNFYKKFYSIDLTDEEITYILDGLNPEGKAYVTD